MYVSPCSAHFYRQRFERLTKEALAVQRQRLEDGLKALEEERKELEDMPAKEAAKLRADLERDAAQMRAKLAAVDELLSES